MLHEPADLIKKSLYWERKYWEQMVEVSNLCFMRWRDSGYLDFDARDRYLAATESANSMLTVWRRRQS